MRIKRTFYFLIATFALLFFALSAQGGGRPFITRWKGEAGKELKIPIFGNNYKLVIKKASDKTVIKTEASITVAGDNYCYKYTPTEDGELLVEAGPEGVSFITFVDSDTKRGSAEKLLKVEAFGTVNWKYMDEAFKYCTNMQFAEGIDTPDLSQVTNMSYMFSGCTSFNQPLNNWDVSNVTNMEGMFNGCTSFNQDLAKWKLEKCPKLELDNCAMSAENLSKSFVGWAAQANIKQGLVLTLDKLKCNASGEAALKQLKEKKQWKVLLPFITRWKGEAGKELKIPIMNENGIANKLVIKRATDEKILKTEYSSSSGYAYTYTPTEDGEFLVEAYLAAGGYIQMYYGGSTEALLRVEKFGTFEWGSMNSAFSGCKKLQFAADIDSPDLSQCPNIRYMFSGCTSFNQPLNNWDVSNVKNMDGLFNGCTSFNQPLNNWNVSNVKNMAGLFNGCTSFNQPLNNWNVSNVQNMINMFSGCSAFNQDLGMWKLEKCERLGFDYCGMSAENFSKSFVGWAAQTNIKKGLVLSIEKLRCNASGEAALKQLKEKKQWEVLLPFITRWKGEAGKALRIPIKNNDKYNKLLIKRAIDEKSLEIGYSKETSYSYTPAEDGELLVEAYLEKGSTIQMSEGSTEALLRIEKFGTFKWGTMQKAFAGCKNLQFAEGIDTPDLSQSPDINNMFQGCTSFNQPLNNWDVSKVTNMERIFSGCTVFNQPLNNWDVSNVTDMYSMFSGCSTFNQDLSGWNVSRVTDMGGLFSNCTSFNQDLGMWKLEKCERLGLDNCGMSAENYSKSLVGWAAQSKINGYVRLSAEGLVYNVSCLAARKQLKDNKYWSISGDETRPFITRWKGQAGQELRIPIRGKDFKLVIKRASDNAVLRTEYSLTIPSDYKDYYKFTPTEYGELLVEAGPEGVEQIRFDYWTSSYAMSLLAVEQFGSVAWKDMYEAFRNCSNMKFAEGIDTPDLSQVTDMRHMFLGCTSFNQSLNNWDVSNVTNMATMFYGCTSFNQSLNNWDVSKVTDMSWMFAGCTSLTIPLNNWKVSSVTKMRGMFSGCTSFNQPLNNWDVSKVTDMASMFYGCTSFNQPLNNWDVSKVTDMGYMFYGCSSFNQPLNNWDVSSVTDMGGLFSNCTSFNQDLGTWKLEKCEKLGLDDCGISAENYSKSFVGWAAQTNIKQGLVLTLDIFKCNATGEAALKHLKEKKQWVILSPFITRWKGETGKELRIPIRTNENAKLVIKRASDEKILVNTTCKGIYSYTPTEDGELLVEVYLKDGSSIRMRDGSFEALVRVEHFGSGKWGTMQNAFSGCTNLQFAENIDTPDLSKVTDMSSMFAGCTSFNLPMSDWDVSKVTNMANMFYGCTSFNQPLNNWNVSSATNMSNMFTECSAFNQPLNNWDVSKVTNMENLFTNCSAFNQDLSKWKLEKCEKLGLDNCGMSVENYSKSFVGWAAQTNLKHGLVLTLDRLKHNARGKVALKQLREKKNWEIKLLFITRWKGEVGKELNIPIGGDKYQLVIKKATDESLLVTENECSGTYSYDPTEDGELLVEAKPDGVTSFRVQEGSAEALLSIEQFGSVKWAGLSFQGAKNMQFAKEVDIPDLRQITDMSYMFSECQVFNQPLNNWDVSQVTSMSSMFSGCTSFDQPLNNWKVGRVTDMIAMFYGCSSFNHPLNNWDVSHVTNMSSMFSGCTAFNQPLNNWDVTQVTDMGSMFAGCTSFNKPLKDWTVRQVTNMEDMFSGSSAFNQDLGMWKLEKCEKLGLANCGMSVKNYNKSLMAWAAQDHINEQLELNATGLKYTTDAKSAHETLINDKMWDIIGDELVLQTVPVTGVTLSQTELSLVKGGTATLTATVVPSDATNQNVSWSSNNKDVAKVANGIVTAVGGGNAIITVTTVEGNHTATCNVTVTVPVTGVTLSQTELTLDKGATETLTATVAPPDATNKKVAWQTDNARVAKVENGVVTAVGKGQTDIHVVTEEGNYSATCHVTVNDNTPPVAVTGVSLSQTELSLVKGGTTTLTATVAPSNATNQNVTWRSNNTAVATVENGTVTAVSEGNATITVTTEDGGHTATCSVEVKSNGTNPVHVTGVSLSQTELSLVKGGTTTLTATVAPSDATNQIVTWRSNNTAVATVENGTVTAVSEGNATITVTTEDGGYTATCSVEVKSNGTNPVHVTGVSLSQTTLSLVKGGTATLTATVAPSDATNQNVSWRSNNTAVATVENGTVTAVSEGNATITVTTEDGGHTATCSVEVKSNGTNPVHVTGVTLAPATLPLKLGTSHTLVASVEPANATNKGVTWSSDNDAVVSVSNKGVVEAKTVGNATITVTTEDGGHTATCEVSVTAEDIVLTGITISPSETTLEVDKETTLSLNFVPITATHRGVKWSSNNPTIATVDEHGKVKGIAAGETTITVVSEKYESVTNTCKVTVIPPTAVEDAVFANVVVSPNPFETQLRISNGNVRGKYALYNTQGVEVAFGALEGAETRINTESLPAGLYLLRLTAENGAVKTYRVVKQ